MTVTVAESAVRSRQSAYVQGMALIGLFVLLSSAREVYVGHLVQRLNPFVVVFFCFAVATAIFTTIYLSSGGRDYLKIIRANLRDVLWVNVATALAWIGGFVALRFIEPSIENSIITAVGPAITILAGVPMGQKRKILASERWSSVGILIVIVFMAAISLLDKAGVSEVTPWRVGVGLVCCLVSGGGIVANTIFSKRLGSKGIPTSFVIAVRFQLLIVVSAIVIASSRPPLALVVSNLPGLLVLATLGITLPLYFLQKGIERSEPITVSFILVLAPGLVYAFQLFDSRLSWSGFTLAGITAVMVLVMFSLVARHRSFR